jgi:uncharacterized membrane protein YfcA
MELSLLLQVVLGACVAGFVQGLSGFAFALTAMAFWAWAVPPQLVGPMVVFASLFGQLATFAVSGRSLEFRRTLPLVIGGVIGVPIGAMLLPHINQNAFKAFVGSILVLWSPAMLFANRLPRITAGGRIADGAAGLVSGVMGGLGGLTGPAAILWLALRGWGRDVQRSVFRSFNITMQALTFSTYAASGLVKTQTLLLCAVVAIAMLIPAFVGARLYARLSDTGFRKLVLLLLFFSGTALLLGSVPRLMAR